MPQKQNNRKDAISLLKEDHKVMLDLLQRLVDASSRPSKSRDNILSKVHDELRTHEQVEQEIFYPAFKEAVQKKDDRQLFFEAREEHHVVDVVLEEINNLHDGEDSFSAKCKLLQELVSRHIKEEEKGMFPLMRKSIEARTLQEMGRQMEERKLAIRSELAS